MDALRIWARELLCAGLLLLAFAPKVLSAQRHTLAVLVADAKSGSPIPDAEVEIDAYHLSNRTDSAGESRFAGLPPGLIVVTAFRIGYKPMSSVASLKGSDTSVVVFLMRRLTPSLDTVRVLAIPGSPYLEEFNQRRKAGLGRYLTFAQLDSSAGYSIVDIVARRFSGLRAAWNRTHTEVALVSTRGGCRVAVYVDGQVRRGDAELTGLSAEEIVGAEYYSIRPPPQYPSGEFACGALLLWTKRY